MIMQEIIVLLHNHYSTVSVTSVSYLFEQDQTGGIFENNLEEIF